MNMRQTILLLLIIMHAFIIMVTNQRTTPSTTSTFYARTSDSNITRIVVDNVEGQIVDNELIIDQTSYPLNGESNITSIVTVNELERLYYGIYNEELSQGQILFFEYSNPNISFIVANLTHAPYSITVDVNNLKILWTSGISEVEFIEDRMTAYTLVYFSDLYSFSGIRTLIVDLQGLFPYADFYIPTFEIALDKTGEDNNEETRLYLLLNNTDILTTSASDLLALPQQLNDSVVNRTSDIYLSRPESAVQSPILSFTINKEVIYFGGYSYLKQYDGKELISIDLTSIEENFTAAVHALEILESNLYIAIDTHEMESIICTYKKELSCFTGGLYGVIEDLKYQQFIRRCKVQCHPTTGICMKDTCLCAIGFSGDDCTTCDGDIYCNGRGTCSLEGNHPVCVCDPGVSGTHCEVDTNEPSPSVFPSESWWANESIPANESWIPSDSMFPSDSFFPNESYPVNESYNESWIPSESSFLPNESYPNNESGWFNITSSEFVGNSSDEFGDEPGDISMGGLILCFGEFGKQGCSEHGSCIATDTCDCDRHYSGRRCQVTTCFDVSSDSKSVCSSHGKCMEYNKCQCTVINWSGKNCEITLCFDIKSNNKNVCSKRGTCIDHNKCRCRTGYSGQNCERTSCYGVSSSNTKTCSGRGRCVDYNRCICNRGWSGDACTMNTCFGINATDPNVCYGHGKCVISKEAKSGSSVCVCNTGWYGEDCSQRMSLFYVRTILTTIYSSSIYSKTHN
jgi:hypothetical protein